MAFIVGLPTLLFLVGSLSLFIYTFWPVALEIPQFTPSGHMTLLSHGIYDTPASWATPLGEKIEQRMAGQSVQAIDWSKYSRSIFRCSVNGYRLGKKMGRKIAATAEVTSLHLIGHSCGAFVVYGLCKGVKENRSEITVQTTYLDPVSNYGGFWKGYGLNHFGNCADFSEAYIDTGDQVPGSNELVPNTHTVDVTNARKKSSYDGNPHLWPLEYYSHLVEKGRNPLLVRESDLADRYPTGTLEKR